LEALPLELKQCILFHQNLTFPLHVADICLALAATLAGTLAIALEPFVPLIIATTSAAGLDSFS